MNTLHAQWIVGFVDGEGCFHVAINTNKKLRFEKQILPEFTVVQHQRDTDLLHRLKSYWNCGVVRKSRKSGNCMSFRVRKHEDLVNIIIPFFEKHPLKTKKHVEFLKFRDIVYSLDRKEHGTREGFDVLCERIQKLRKFTCETFPEDKVQPLTSDSSEDS